MRFVDRTGPGALGLNYMWLPTWVGMNTALIAEIDAKLSELIVGKELTVETLEGAHQLVLTFLQERFPNLKGLGDYLDGIKFVQDHGD